MPPMKAMKVARMDMRNRALCYSLRKPPPGGKKVKIADIIKKKMVVKTDGRAPSPGAISEAAETYLDPKEKVGRKVGSRKTSKADDKQILTTFKTQRPDGHGVDSRVVHAALPKKVKKKVSRKTVIRRLGEKGFKAQKKLSRSDSGVKWRKKRLAFAKLHRSKTPSQWVSQVQAVADMKLFTFYPKSLKPRFKQLRAPWTYMTDEEKKKPAFLRPKRWFKKKDYKKAKHQKVFGLTTSTGKALSFLCPPEFTTEKFAIAVQSKIVPFMKKCFPTMRTRVILLDGEKLLHGPAAKAAFAKGNIKAFPRWPASSPDVNPQENVWPWAENRLRQLEDDDDTFEDFGFTAARAVREFPTASGKKLIPSMAKRMTEVIENDGGMIGR